MLRALMEVASRQVGRIVSNVVRRAVYTVVALVFLTIALVFAALSLFLWLVTITTPPLAGLAVAALALVIGFIALMLAGRQSAAPAPAASEPLPRDARAGSSSLTAEAEALGRRFGQEAGAYPLVLAAFVLGLALSRRRR